MLSFQSPSKAETTASKLSKEAVDDSSCAPETLTNAALLSSPLQVPSSATVSVASTKTTSSKRRARTWKELHRDTCLQRHSLQATAVQVRESQDTNVPLPLASTIVDATDPSLVDKLVALYQAEQRLVTMTTTTPMTTPDASNKTRTRATLTTPARLYAAVSTTAAVLTSPLRAFGNYVLKDRDDDYAVQRDWHQENDHAVTVTISRVSVSLSAATSTAAQVPVSPHTAVIHTDLLLQCLQILQAAAAKESPVRVVRLVGALPAYSWQGWLQRTAAAAAIYDDAELAEFLGRLPESQTDLLLKCLDAAASSSVAVLRRDSAADVVLLGRVTNDDRDKHVRVALLDVECTAAQVQGRTDATTAKLGACRARAVQAIRAGHTAQALAEFKRSKLHETTQAQCYDQMHTLEALQQTLEAAEANRDTVQVLRHAATTLSQMRQPLEQVDAVMDDLQEETEHVAVISDTLAAHGGVSGTDTVDEEDELLAELLALTIDDNNDDSDTTGATIATKNDVVTTNTDTAVDGNETQQSNDIKHVSEAKQPRKNASLQSLLAS